MRSARKKRGPQPRQVAIVSENDLAVRAWATRLHARGEFTDAVSTVCLHRSDDKHDFMRWATDNLTVVPIPKDPKARFEYFNRDLKTLKEAKLLSLRFISRWYRKIGAPAHDWPLEQGVEMDIELPYDMR